MRELVFVAITSGYVVHLHGSSFDCYMDGLVVGDIRALYGRTSVEWRE